MIMDKNEIYDAIEDDSWAMADRRASYYNAPPSPRIMPEKYQATSQREINECLLVIDNFLHENLFEQLKTASHLMAKKTKGWARPVNIIDKQLIADEQQFGKTELSQQERDKLETAIDQTLAVVHKKLEALTYDNAIVKYNTWINTGSQSSQYNQEDFHSWHYDSDEYMEFCLPQHWLRFPVWGAIFYINQPQEEQHFTVFDNHKIAQKIRSLPNRLVIFDPIYMHKVIGHTNSNDTNDARLVMVFNAWDYHALDIDIHINSVTQETKTP
jgi:hypothetical protein